MPASSPSLSCPQTIRNRPPPNATSTSRTIGLWATLLTGNDGDEEPSGQTWLAGTRESLVEAWRFLAGNRPAFITMMLLVLASTANLVMVTLAPRFTQQVLELGPEYAVFVFGPAVVGMLGGLALVPRAVHRVRPRVLALLGFLLMVVSLLAMGEAGPLTRLFQSLNPLWLNDPGPFGRGPQTADRCLLMLHGGAEGGIRRSWGIR